MLDFNPINDPNTNIIFTQKKEFFLEMNEWEAKDAICEIGRRVWTKNYIASNDGNLSFKINEDRIVATPTLISKGFMKPSDLVVVNMKGEKVSGERVPTSEIKLHLHIYKSRPDISAVVHVHPPHATAFAIARKQLPKCILPEVEIFLGQIPITDYATPGSEEFARSIDPYIKNHFAFILTNHGAVTLGKDPFDAYYKMETLDQYCMILILAKQIGEWNTLDYKAMSEIFSIKERLGIPDPRSDFKCVEEICKPGVSPDPQSQPAKSPQSKEAKSPQSPNPEIESLVKIILKEKGLI